MLRSKPLAFCAVIFLLGATSARANPSDGLFDWKSLPNLPANLVQPFLASDNGVLLVAGGRTVHEGRPLANGQAYLLPPTASAWKPAATLPVAVWGGATLSTGHSIVGIGGQTDASVDSVWQIEIQGADTAKIGPLPALPEPLSSPGAALLGDTVYVSGVSGRLKGRPQNQLWALSLNAQESGWRVLEQVPGVPRYDAAVATSGGNLYVCGGHDANGEFLRDCFRYTPGAGWSFIAPLPEGRAVGPAIPYGQAHLLFFGDEVLAYDTITDTWTHYGMSPPASGPRTATVLDGNPVLVCPGDHVTRVYFGSPIPRKGAFTILDYVALVLYFGILVGMGAYFARRERTTEDFFLGGRRVPWWAVGLSIFGTSLSAITYLAIPAKAYATDWVFILSNLGILAVAPFVVRYYLPRFREAPITTAYEYLETRFNFPIRVYGSLVFLSFQIGRSGYRVVPARHRPVRSNRTQHLRVHPRHGRVDHDLHHDGRY